MALETGLLFLFLLSTQGDGPQDKEQLADSEVTDWEMGLLLDGLLEEAYPHTNHCGNKL